MNTRQMEIFVNIVRYGNFSNAAKKMYLSQPAVSANIDLLEKELDTKLLVRQGRKAALTEKGRVFYESALNILALTEQTVNCMKNDGALTGNIRFISSFVPGHYLLPGYIHQFHRMNPGVTFETVIRNSKETVDGVVNNFFDMGFVGSPVKNDCITQKHIYTDNMVLVAPNKAPYTDLPPIIKPDAIKAMPFIMRTWGSSTLSIAENELQKNGVNMEDLNIIAEFDSGEAIIQSIKLNMGVSILSTICIKEDPSLLTFLIDGVAMKRDFYAIIQNSEYLPPRVTRFFESLPALD